MHNIKVITDTDSSLSPRLAAEHGIDQIPIGIHFNGTSYTTGVDIDDRLLFKKVDELRILPTTSAPNPAAYVAAFEEAFAQGASAIICVCVSSQVSSTYESAVAARAHFPEREIHVIDTRNLSMAQGFMALAAAEAAARQASPAEIAAQVTGMRTKIHTIAMLPTLKYLALSGRVNKFVAGLADTIHIKPILTVQDGKLSLLEKVRTRKKAISRVTELLDGAVQTKKIERLAIVHVNDPEGAAEMETYLRDALDCPSKIVVTEFTPGLSVHSGSGLVGVIAQTE